MFQWGPSRTWTTNSRTCFTEHCEHYYEPWDLHMGSCVALRVFVGALANSSGIRPVASQVHHVLFQGFQATPHCDTCSPLNIRKFIFNHVETRSVASHCIVRRALRILREGSDILPLPRCPPSNTLYARLLRATFVILFFLVAGLCSIY